MAPDDPDRERVNVFPIGDRYLFRHYFDEEAVFERLKPFYEPQEYRFNVPEHRCEGVRAFLEDREYEVVVVDDPAPFVVVVRKYTEHPENVFKAAVDRRDTPEHNCFLLRDRESVELAIDRGARRLSTADLDVEFA